MPATPFRLRPLLPALASGILVLATVAGVQAQDGGSFFDQLFGRPTQPAPTQPGWGGGDALPLTVRPRRRASYGQQQRLKTRYAALPREDADGISGKQVVDQKAIQDNPTKAILEDKTLQPGDIVVLPRGPKVFLGGAQKRHRMSDFEDVKNSEFVDKKTRQQLLAMMVPVGAMPADQARKVMAQKRKLAQPDEIAAVEAHNGATGPRVVNPWSVAP